MFLLIPIKVLDQIFQVRDSAIAAKEGRKPKAVRFDGQVTPTGRERSEVESGFISALCDLGWYTCSLCVYRKPSVYVYYLYILTILSTLNYKCSILLQNGKLQVSVGRIVRVFSYI